MAEASPTECSDKYKVIHDKDCHEFYIKCGNEKAFLQYEILNEEGEVDLFHTEVPTSQRGKGIAKILAKNAFDYFSKEQNVKMKLTCSYLQKYAKENYQNL